MFKASKTNKTRKSAKITTNPQNEVSPQVPAPSTVNGAPSPSTVNGAPASTTANVAPAATTANGAPAATTANVAPAPSSVNGAPAATTENKAEGDEAPAKSTYDINALDLSEQRRIEEERKMLEAAKHPRSFLPSISSITNALKKLPIPSLPPIPVVVMAKAAKMVPILMTIVDKISDPDIINRISTYIEKSQELAIAKKEKELEKLKGGGIQFFTEEECSFF